MQTILMCPQQLCGAQRHLEVQLRSNSRYQTRFQMRCKQSLLSDLRGRRNFKPLRSIVFEEGELAPEIQQGTRVKVKADLTVYHVPKHPKMNLKGLEGEVLDNVVNYKNSKISANLPYKVQFIQPQEGKDLKFFAHLRADELDLL